MPPARFERAAPGSESAFLLEGSEGTGENLPDILRCLGKQQVQDHGKVAPDAALHGLRRLEEQVPDMRQIHETAGYGEEEADLVLAATAGPPRHLMKFRAVHGAEGLTVEQVRIEQDDGPRGKIDAGGDGRGRENRVEASLLH